MKRIISIIFFSLLLAFISCGSKPNSVFADGFDSNIGIRFTSRQDTSSQSSSSNESSSGGSNHSSESSSSNEDSHLDGTSDSDGIDNHSDDKLPDSNSYVGSGSSAKAKSVNESKHSLSSQKLPNTGDTGYLYVLTASLLILLAIDLFFTKLLFNV